MSAVVTITRRFSACYTHRLIKEMHRESHLFTQGQRSGGEQGLSSIRAHLMSEIGTGQVAQGREEKE